MDGEVGTDLSPDRETLAPEMMWTLMRFEREVTAVQPLPGMGTSILFSLKVKNGCTQTRSHRNEMSSVQVGHSPGSLPRLGSGPGLAPSLRVTNTFRRHRVVRCPSPRHRPRSFVPFCVCSFV